VLRNGPLVSSHSRIKLVIDAPAAALRIVNPGSGRIEDRFSTTAPTKQRSSAPLKALRYLLVQICACLQAIIKYTRHITTDSVYHPSEEVLLSDCGTLADPAQTA